MTELYYKKESYEIVGLCMEVHKILGKGHNDSLYKDAVEYELVHNSIPYVKRKKFRVKYKDVILPHVYVTDFIIYGKILLVIKAVEKLMSAHVKITLNILAASEIKLGLIFNFGENSLKFQRIVL